MKEAFATLPGVGALTIGELARQDLTREKFLAAHPDAVLLQLNEVGSELNSGATSPAGFRTLEIDPSSIRKKAQKLLALPVLELKKRHGANAFGLMVTLGRATNNDIVLPHQAISKFHVSFVKARDGTWMIEDASSNGTWVDERKLLSRQRTPLRTGALIDLAHAVAFTFLVPERLYDEVASARRLSGVSEAEPPHPGAPRPRP